MQSDDFPFFVGGYFLDRKQSYLVTELTEDHMVVLYEDGNTDVLDREHMQTKARIYKNMLLEYKDFHPKDSDDYFRSLGFLANKGRFDAELPAKSVHNFLRNYEEHTGESITDKTPGVIPLGDVDKWGPELRIYFPDTDLNIDLGEDVQICDGPAPGGLRINNNSLWMRLIRMGFRVGSAHDIQAILENIPPDKIVFFEEGLNR